MQEAQSALRDMERQRMLDRLEALEVANQVSAQHCSIAGRIRVLLSLVEPIQFSAKCKVVNTYAHPVRKRPA